MTVPQKSVNQRASSAATDDLGTWRDVWWLYLGVHTVTLVLAVGFLAAVWLLARPLALIFLSMVIANALSPVVNQLMRIMPRTLAVVLIFLGLVLLFALLLALIIPSVLDEAQVFQDRIPEVLDTVEDRLRNWGMMEDDVSLWDRVVSSFSQLGPRAIQVSLVVFSGGVDIALVFITSLYILVEAPHIRDFVLSLVPRQRKASFASVADEMLTAAGGYVKGVVWQGALIGTASFIGFTLIGLEFPLLLAFLMALGEILPNIGPTVSGSVAVATALLISPTVALITLVFVIAVQQVESNLIIPYVMHKQVNISPLMVIIAVFAGGAVGGIIGVIIAIPLTAALRVLVVRVIAPIIREKTGAAGRHPSPPDPL